MTNERKGSDGSNEADEQVSRVYRELAVERAPERLNEAILRRASKAARPPYARSILWAKPVAWAAVVAICLAITLQVTQMPAPEHIPVTLPGMSPSTEAVEADDAAASMPAKPSSVEELALPEESAVADDTTSDIAQRRVDETVARKLEQTQTEPATDPLRAAVPMVTDGPAGHDDASTTTTESMRPDMAEFELQDVGMPRSAEDAARPRSGAEQRAAVSALASRSIMAEERAADCDEEARATPASWYACIVDLEAAGQTAAAERQRKLLAESFPDFEMP